MQGYLKDVAYVLFAESEVAKVAAETMNNYLMFGQRIRCQVMTKTIPPTILNGPRLVRQAPMKHRVLYEKARDTNEQLDDEEDEQYKVRFILNKIKLQCKLFSKVY